MKKMSLSRLLAAALAVGALGWSTGAQAHCDSLDGPVVGQARTALETGNVKLVLGWVRQADEPEVRTAFEQAVAVRRAGGAARDLADRSFFETLVRVHRSGEGAPYTGLKPAGHIEPAVAAADKPLPHGQQKPVAQMIAQQTERGLHERFDAAVKSKPRDPGDVDAARAHVGKYVQYVHYVEGLYQAADAAHGQDAAAPDKPPAHQH